MSDKEQARDEGLNEALGSPAEAPKQPLSPLRKKEYSDDEEAWWEDRSLAEKILIGIGLGLLGIGLLALLGWVVMLLWNWLMPDIFGLKTIDYWQAWGLLLLSFILFKGWGSNDGERRGDRRRRRQLRRFMKEQGSGKHKATEES